MGAFRLVSMMAATGMLGGVVGVVGLASLPGCTSYTNVPGPESAIAGQDPNGRQASRAAETGLAWTIRRHPVDGPFLINLPHGTSTETARSIASSLGPMAQVPVSETTDLPVYHVSRVWIRLSDAKVDVTFPSKDGLGRDVQRGVTTWMSAVAHPWRVTRGQYWSPGTVPIPSIWIPIPQAELDAIAEAERAATRAARQPTPPPATEPVAEPAAPLTPPPSQAQPAAPAIPQEQPAPTPPPPPAASPDTAPSGAPVYREIPVGGGY